MSAARRILFAGSLRPDAPLPLQIRDNIRRAVLAGQLSSGARLPSSRVLAAELGVSRNTVIDAYDQLLSEGYVETRRGAGVFVAGDLAIASEPRGAVAATSHRHLSARGEKTAGIATSHSAGALRPFSPGLPALDPALLVSWFRTSARVRRRVTAALLKYGDPSGYEPLRRVIAAHLAPARGVRCDADRVVITAGTQHALGIAAHLLLDPGEPAWIEDPGYPGAGAALAAAGARLVHVAVDRDGLDVGAGIARSPGARVAYVSPSHQYPLGVTMTLARRLELLRWAEGAKAWILEDDYDSEFRYDGRMLPALQGLEAGDRVVYLGTFSKTLFPSIRIGYAIVPPPLVQPFRKAVEIAGQSPSLLEQAALHDFIESGAYARHLKQVRSLYDERHGVFCRAVRSQAGALTLSGEAMGLHATGILETGRDDRRLSARADERHLSLAPLSVYYGGPDRTDGFVMGYGHLPPAQILRGVRALATLLER